MKSTSIIPGATLVSGREFAWGSRTFVMGIVNVTPDSFSGDGLGTDVQAAVDQAKRFEEWGAHIIDVGGESTRPPAIYKDARPVTDDEELGRVIPVIEALSRSVDLPISIDTFKARVADEAVQAGAGLVNDIWGMKRDADMARVVASHGVPVVLMHNQSHTQYAEVVSDMIRALASMAENAMSNGIDRSNIIIDPGIGFGKNFQQNLEVMRRLREFRSLGLPLLIGTSRKSSIGRVLGVPENDRVEGTAATVALAIANGADMIRVHDVKEMARVAKMSDAIVRGCAEA